MIRTLRCGLAAALIGGLASAADASMVVDASGTVTAGAASQQVMAAKSSRTYLMCQNPITATETLFVNFDAAASTTAGSLELAPGGSVSFHGQSFVPTGAVNVTAATTGHRFVCKQG